MWFDTILWLAAIVAFISVEAATTALVSVWFAVGAAAAMVVSLFTVSFGWQLLVFAVVSAVTLALMVPGLLRRRGHAQPPVTNGSASRALFWWILSPACRAACGWTALTGRPAPVCRLPRARAVRSPPWTVPYLS